MCGVCNITTVPVCNLAGGCSVQTLDFIKMATISGGAGMGLFLTVIKETIQKKKDEGKKRK